MPLPTGTHPAVAALRALCCSKVHLPRSAAPELIHFLWAKRVFPALPMAPYGILGTLWSSGAPCC